MVVAELLRAVQIEVPGRLGPADGRYLVRDDAGEPAEVIVIATLGAQRARGRLRRGRPVPVEDPGATPLPVTRVTVIQPEPLESRAEAVAWLERTSADAEQAAPLVTAAMRTLNRLLHAHRSATGDPYVPELSTQSGAVLRLGVGTGDQLADGHWIEARELPPDKAAVRRARVDDIRPQERIAAVLGGKERIDACETLMLRARADFDQGRHREGALQLAAALDALLAELGGGEIDGPGEDRGDHPPEGASQERDLAALRERHVAVRTAAESALTNEPTPEALHGLNEALQLGERVLRRRRATS